MWEGDPVAGATDDEAREFAQSYMKFMEWIHSEHFARQDRNPVVALVQDFLGEAGRAHSVVARNLPEFEHVNLQTALNHWLSEDGRTAAVHGIAVPPHYDRIRLHHLIGGEGIRARKIKVEGPLTIKSAPRCR